MKTLGSRRPVEPARRGVALLLALLLLMVVIAITAQIRVTTMTGERVARNDLALSNMDLSIESALLNLHETLKTDGDQATQGGGASAPPAAGQPAAGGQQGGTPAANPASSSQGQASDSQRDEWYAPQRTEINEIRLRIFVQDEDSKYNVLNLLDPDEKAAQAAHDRVLRILDLAREGSRQFDIDPRLAEEMVKTMIEHMQRRDQSKIPRPKLLTDDEDADHGFPLSLEEFAALSPFEEHHFRDFRDSDGEVVHSIGSFLTVWSSVGVAEDLPSAAAGGAGGGGAGSSGSGSSSGTSGSSSSSSKGKSGSSSSAQQGSSAQSGSSSTSGSSAQSGSSGQSGQTGSGGQAGTAGQAGTGGQSGTSSGSGSTTSGGYAVNVNTAPAAVLKGLFDDREVHPRFFDRVLEYRNLEEEEEEGEKSQSDEEAEEEIRYDEYGREVIERRIFESLGELADVEGYQDLTAEAQAQLNQLLTTTSNVFSIYVVARRSTALEGDRTQGLSPEDVRRLEETAGDTLVRVVRSVVWRHVVDDEVVLTPILRWQVLDYVPFEVLDFPPEDR